MANRYSSPPELTVDSDGSYAATLHTNQIAQLRAWRKSEEEEDLLAVLQTVNAIASGLRTTG